MTRSTILPLCQRYRADRQYNWKRLTGRFTTDTINADVKSLDGYKYAQAFTHKNGFAAIYPMEQLGGLDTSEALKDFANVFGVPDFLTYDGAAPQTGRNTLPADGA